MDEARTHIALSAAQVRESGAAIIDAASRIRHELGASSTVLVLGCGDSLAAAELATKSGHHTMSAGDVAWGGLAPNEGQPVVALSLSGGTNATVTAAKVAKAAGSTVVAVTTDSASPLATTADHAIVIPTPPACTSAPAGGYLMMGLAIAGLAGASTEAMPDTLAAMLDDLAAATAGEPLLPPAALPAAISVCALPELQAARRFWMLKLIEATGVAARSVPLEEWGHVDYFIGEQPHLDVVLLGGHGRERAAELLNTMIRVGHDHCVFDVVTRLGAVLQSSDADWVLTNLVVGAAGALFADECARTWGRIPFRGGDVDLSAAHLQRPSVAMS